MKKIFGLTFLSAILFSACTFSDFIVDKTAVHNELVYNMDNIFVEEKNYWDVYIAMQDGDDGTELRAAYDSFAAAVGALYLFFDDTTFHSSQQLVVDAYETEYKPFITKYLDSTGDFVSSVEESGYTFDKYYGELEPLDQLSTDYIDVHNKFIGIINIQADTSTSGGTY